jgi:curved DNA-binding protein CbpA
MRWSTLAIVLGIPHSADLHQILNAYIVHSLRSFPDRPGMDPDDRPEQLLQFQEIGDAYYTLSDLHRRNEYIAADRQLQYFLGDATSTAEERQPLYLQQFLVAVNISLQKTYAWTITGLMSGAVAGFVVAGPVGAVAGAGMGSYSGSVRDTTGQTILQQYQSYTLEQKFAIFKKLCTQFRTLSALTT